MPSTKLNKDNLINHFHYSKWVYLVIAVGVFFIGNMAYTMTAYRSPPERKVDFQFVRGYINTEPIQAIADEIMQGAEQIDPTLEEIGVYNIAYSGDAETDVYGAQKFMVMIAAREGDVYMLNRQLTEQLASQGALTPLDDYIEAGLIDADGLDLSPGTFAEPADEEDGQPSGIERVYAIPAGGLVRLSEPDIECDHTDAYLVLMKYSANPETSVKVMQRMMDALSQPSPKQPTEENEP